MVDNTVVVLVVTPVLTAGEVMVKVVVDGLVARDVLSRVRTQYKQNPEFYSRILGRSARDSCGRGLLGCAFSRGCHSLGLVQ